MQHISSGEKNKEKIRKTIKTVLIVAIAIATLTHEIRIIEPIFNTICEKEAKSIATKICNNEATEVMKKYEYDDLVTIMKDEKGNVNMVKANIIPINKIISDVAVEVQYELEAISSKEIPIKLGTFTGIKLLSGRGPNVNFKVFNEGSVLTDFKSEFTQAGINQTLHRMYLEIKCDISVLTPFSTVNEVIVNQIIIAENVIVGTTPNTYYNFDNLTSNQAILESME